MKPGKFIFVMLFLSLLGQASAATTNESHVVLEGDDGEGMIFFPRQVEEGPDGNLYILDSGDSFIKVYTSAGQYLKKLGGRGEGPGEFQRTDGATFGFTDNGKLFFTEYFGGHRWITIMELNGDLVRTFSPQLEVSFGIQAASSLCDSGFLVEFVYSSAPRAKGDYFFYDKPQSLALVDSLGAIVSEIANTNYTKMISYSPNGATTNLPFTPRFIWTPINNNEVIWSDGMTPHFQVFNFSGQLIREIETPLPQPQQVSKSDLQQWRINRENEMSSLNPVWWDRFGKVIQEYKKPLYDKPILRGITTTPGGNLLVQGWTYSDSGESLYWLLDRLGEDLGRFSFAAWNVHFSDHFLLFVTYDDEGNPQVHAVEHLGDEVAAMAKIREVVESMVE
jgi:hypothetical protein